ncbi:MAG: hypothetical protein JZU53_09820 [Paludibacter sp.]|nr:hypothetical protein [Paludibacter sp.]
MERINKLLENYFKGETTLAEEAELKQYFATGTIAPEHKPYSALFQAFGQEVQQQYTTPMTIVLPKQSSGKRMWVRAVVYSGIAASLVLAVWIQRPRQEEDYAIIRGRRIDNPEYAQRYAEKKLNAVNEMLRYKLKPLMDAQALKDNLRNVDEGENDKNQIIE